MLAGATVTITNVNTGLTRTILTNDSGDYLVPLLLAFYSPARADSQRLDRKEIVATFSIAALDPENGDLGVAVQSKFFNAAAIVPWAKAGVGAVATQAYANYNFGPEGLRLLESGLTAADRLMAALEAGRAAMRAACSRPGCFR